MKPQENYNTHRHDDSMYHTGEESIHSETMVHTDPAISQHFADERSAGHQPTELDHDDADRRTLDESQADEDDKD
jgi:hypothetical protein